MEDKFVTLTVDEWLQEYCENKRIDGAIKKTGKMLRTSYEGKISAFIGAIFHVKFTMVVEHNRTKRLRNVISTYLYCSTCFNLSKDKKNKNKFNCVKVSLDRFHNITIIYTKCHLNSFDSDESKKFGLNNFAKTTEIYDEDQIRLVQINETNKKEEDEVENEDVEGE